MVVLVLTLAAGGLAALLTLPLVAGELPGPIEAMARLPERLWAQVFPPRVPAAALMTGLTPPEQRAVAALAPRLDGRIVWSSNRGGNHDLYRLDLAERAVRRLTTHPHVDFFARVSPDGRQVVFLRSQRPWVSFREQAAWDVMLMQADGTGETRIVEGGYHPTWTPDGRGIVFNRGRQLLRVDLASRQESVLLDGAREIRGLTEIGDAELGPDGRRLTFYGRGAQSGIAVFDLSTRTLVPLTLASACQPTWAPDGRTVVWVEAEGRGGTRVMAGPPDGSGRRVLIDLPGAHSHEYFPRLSGDGRWLIWGAAAQGHEHDRADYEIFVWELGTPPEGAVRLTHHPGNDQWPDLWTPPRRAAVDQRPG
jgi:Tol biopolymer transport system component